MNINKDISNFLTGHTESMLDLLKRLVVTQSGSRNKPGIDKIGLIIRKEMETMGFSCTLQKESILGDHIIARSPEYAPDKKQILITGHMDTVFPQDTDFNYFKQGEEHCYGPGVADMKGGLVVGVYAIKSLFHTCGLSGLPITFIFNSDEEIGSPGSRKLIQDEAKKSRIAFVLEAGGLKGEIVTGRKGNLSAELKITGEAGHAAFAKKNKASAILELAHKTIAIEKLNEPEKGISANVGTINGGIGPNTIPQHASAKLDFRFLTPNDLDQLTSRIKEICNKTTIPGTSTSLKITSGRPAMPETEETMALFQKIKDMADSINIPVVSELRQGVSDANLIASVGTPVIDGFGPIGAKDHSEDEFIQTDSLLDRSILFANILSNLGKE
jgi:glutamate carboxypeptidase